MSDTDTRASVLVDFTAVVPTRCPCGWSRRAFMDVPDSPVSVHQVEIELDAQTHYHKRQTEIYYILECGDDAQMELDGECVPVRPGMSIYIPPGTRHRAVGKMRILNIVSPKFDPHDEWFD